MIFFNSDTKFSKLEILELDSLFLNIHQFAKIKFELKSRHQEDIKNNPVNGESIHYSYLLKGKDRVNIICKKHYIKNKNEYMSFVHTFVHRYKYMPDLENFPTVFFEIQTNKHKNDIMYHVSKKDWKKKALDLIESTIK